MGRQLRKIEGKTFRLDKAWRKILDHLVTAPWPDSKKVEFLQWVMAEAGALVFVRLEHREPSFGEFPVTRAYPQLGNPADQETVTGRETALDHQSVAYETLCHLGVACRRVRVDVWCSE